MRPLSLCAPRLACAPLVFFSLCFFLLCLSTVHADEPNDTFAQATVLDAGTLTVTDDLSPGTGPAPNTFLGAFDADGFDPFDNLIDDDDNNSTLGNGEASGLIGIDINPNGSIRLIVTGDGDFDFVGDHEEQGGYKAVVEVFDSGNNTIDNFSFTNTLQADMTDEHTFANSNWIGGNYSVNLDNTIDGFSGGDVDFFTFTGLTSGAMFSAETSAVGAIDTLLAWYDDTGTQIAQDDDSGSGVLSLLTGSVPASGQLTFAVTGSGDDNFVGEHGQQEIFNLQLTLDGSGFDADFDGDGDVDADDLTHPTLGWQARYGNGLDGNDFLTWQQELGSGAGLLAVSQPVPEPTTLCLALFAFAALATRIRHRF